MNREEFGNLIKEIGNLKLKSLYAFEDCDVFNKVGECVAEGLDVDKHRWYEITTSVYDCGDWFLGVCGVSHLFSEEMSYDDCCVATVAFEMEEVQTVTYKPKKQS